jgi:uncharacterized membrane protein
MNSMTRALITGASVAAGFFAVRSLSRKRIDTLPYGYGIKLKKEILIQQSPAKLYKYWRDLSNTSELFDGLLSVKAVDERRSRWTLKAPGGVTLAWDAEITVDREGEMIGWRSLERADVDNAGYVRFEPTLDGRGSIARIALQYNPPAGKLGAALAAVMGESPSRLIEQALLRLKQRMEAGEAGQRRNERVEIASEESFPASDAPSWTGTAGPIVGATPRSRPGGLH